MGFASFFESLSNAYSGIKSTVSNIFHEGKNILHKVRGGFDWFDNEINKLSSIPFVNTLVSGAKDFLQYDTIKSVIQDIDNMAQSSELEAYGGMIFPSSVCLCSSNVIVLFICYSINSDLKCFVPLIVILKQLKGCLVPKEILKMRYISNIVNYSKK